MQTDSHNFRQVSSPQRKPSPGSLLKNYSHRPNSAMKLKYDPENSSHSPLRNESQTSKKLSVSRHPTTVTSSTGSRAYESKLYGMRKKNEEETSPAPLSKSTSKWDRHLSIDTNENAGNYSFLGLKGYSVSQTSTHALTKPSPQMNSSLSSKYMLYNSNSTPSSAVSYSLPYRGATTPGGTPGSATKKYSSTSTSKDYSLNSSTSSLGNERFVLNESHMKEVRNNSYSFSQNPIKMSHYEEEPVILPPFEPTKCSVKQNGVIRGYAVNTHQGIVRNYNEDRVAIILNIMRPSHVGPNEEWPLCSFFGVYDGHGGTACPDFLRDNLHQYVISDKNFPKNPIEALRRGFEEAEKAFREIAQRSATEIDRSGSCAIVALIVEDMCYIANVGDSRVAASFEQGKKVFPLSRDHKPTDKDEQKRILSFGGKIYQSQINQPPGYPGPKVLLGPHRVFPGRLSVSRTFGDIEAKLPRFGGNPYVVIAEPEIKAYKVTKDWDFIVLASDGIYDKMENQDVVKSIWDSTIERESDIHKQSAAAVEKLMKDSLIKKTMDNITVVMVTFEGFEKRIFPAPGEELNLEAEKVYQPLQRSLLANSSHYNTPSQKSFLNTSNERQTFASSVGRKYENPFSSSFDYTVSSQLEKQWRGY